MAIYFTSEEAAREGERKEPPAELKAQMEEMDALSVGVPEFFDLKRGGGGPCRFSPGCPASTSAAPAPPTRRRPARCLDRGRPRLLGAPHAAPRIPEQPLPWCGQNLSCRQGAQCGPECRAAGDQLRPLSAGTGSPTRSLGTSSMCHSGGLACFTSPALPPWDHPTWCSPWAASGSRASSTGRDTRQRRCCSCAGGLVPVRLWPFAAALHGGSPRRAAACASRARPASPRRLTAQPAARLGVCRGAGRGAGRGRLPAGRPLPAGKWTGGRADGAVLRRPAAPTRRCRWPGCGPAANWPSCASVTCASPSRRPPPCCGSVPPGWSCRRPAWLPSRPAPKDGSPACSSPPSRCMATPTRPASWPPARAGRTGQPVPGAAGPATPLVALPPPVRRPVRGPACGRPSRSGWAGSIRPQRPGASATLI